jgi:diguanylate cyclase (GGDEF)-like protein
VPTPIATEQLALAAVAGLVILAAAGLAYAACRLGGRSRRRDEKSGAEPADRADEEMRELRKSVWILQNENRNLSTFLLLLPDFAKELNSSMEKRRVAPLLRRMLEQIFDPEQILIFYTTHRNDGLVLVDEKGLPASADRSRVIPFGEGRVGWVGSHQICMDESDFQQKARFVKADLDAARQPHFKVELAAPMANKDRTLGVITVGGMLRHPKNEKSMLRMVADLGSIALNNAFLFHQMDQIANSDGLTGLLNKRFFLTRLAEELIRAESRHEEFSLFIFDIDHFKHYNDGNGHVAGDEALKLTGRILRETLREDDIPCRYGGEEFVVLLPNTSKKGAMVVAEKIRAAIQTHEYPKEKSQPLGDLTISGGVATFPFDARTSAELIGAADDALYKAKRGGRNRVLAFEPRYLSESEETAEAAACGRESS